MIPQTIIRRVLISSQDYPKMRQHCLVKSPHGNRNLYDTCEWTPLTPNDLLIDILKSRGEYSPKSYFYKHRQDCYDRYTEDFKIYIRDNQIKGRKRHSRYEVNFGWATVIKVKE